MRDVLVNEDYQAPWSRSPAVIVDVGANTGISAIWFASKYPQAKVIAIEPEASNYELLVSNTREYENIECVQAAVWHSDGEVSFINPNGMQSDSYQVDAIGNADADRQFSVRSLTVETLLAEHELTQIDLLKIDVEGAEIEIFSSSGSWIDRVSEIVVELHDRHRPGCSDAFRSAVANGFAERAERGENTFVRRTLIDDGCVGDGRKLRGVAGRKVRGVVAC